MQAEGGKPNVTRPVPNYSSFEFFYLKFDHSSYLKKIYRKQPKASLVSDQRAYLQDNNIF